MLTKKTSLFVLILLITLAHIGLLSLHFEWPKRLSFRQPDIGASMIAAGLWQSIEPIKTDTQESKDSESINKEEVQASSSSSRTSLGAFTKRSSSEIEALDAFEMSQKIREQLLLNEFRSRSSHAESALVQLRLILFQNQEASEKLICCTVSNTVDNASCTDPTAEIYYKKIADSLRSQLNAIQFLGISKICNRD